MKKVFMLCNAHIDPVWLWTWPEGAAEALSTFRVAADFCERFDGFVFNHNESLLYEWVEEHEPALFARIQALVRAGKWNVMGGWYIQPDCNLPCGESIIRQIRIGREYFLKKFGVAPSTAVNFDSFGHSRGLVQIMAKAGYDSYICCRAGKKLPHGDYRWRGFDGSELKLHVSQEMYGSLKGDAANKILRIADSNPEKSDVFALWGIGNHGGGASEPDLEAIAALAAERKDLQLIHAAAEDYFKTFDKKSLPLVERSLGPVMQGCYTSMAQIKQAHRSVECRLSRCEKMLAHSGITYRQDTLKEAEKALLFSEFHDILPGTMIQPAEKNSLQLLGFAGEIIDRLTLKAFFALCSGQTAAKRGEIPVMAYNPHPYEIETEISVPFSLESQNWTDGESTIATAYTEDGKVLATQHEKEESSINLDWRKRIVFRAKLKPMQMNRFNCRLEAKMNVPPYQAYDEDENCIWLRSAEKEVAVSKRTGLINHYCEGGRQLLRPGSGTLCVMSDNEDPWGMTVDRFTGRIGEFQLISAKEANEFYCHPGKTFENVRVTENGAVRMKIEAVFRYANSFALVTYVIPKEGPGFDVKLHTWINEGNLMLKYRLDANLGDADFLGQTIFGTETFPTDQTESVFQQWCGLKNSSSGVCVINTGTYGGSSDGESLYLSVMRTPVYAAHPIAGRALVPEHRSCEHIDMGEREFSFTILPYRNEISQLASLRNEPPYILTYFPSGDGSKPQTALTLTNRNILLSYFHKEEQSFLIRLFNSSEGSQTTTMRCFGVETELMLGGFEVKTFILNNGLLQETDILGKL